MPHRKPTLKSLEGAIWLSTLTEHIQTTQVLAPTSVYTDDPECSRLCKIGACDVESLAAVHNLSRALLDGMNAELDKYIVCVADVEMSHAGANSFTNSVVAF